MQHGLCKTELLPYRYALINDTRDRKYVIITSRERPVRLIIVTLAVHIEPITGGGGVLRQNGSAQ